MSLFFFDNVGNFADQSTYVVLYTHNQARMQTLRKGARTFTKIYEGAEREHYLQGSGGMPPGLFLSFPLSEANILCSQIAISILLRIFYEQAQYQFHTSYEYH